LLSKSIQKGEFSRGGVFIQVRHPPWGQKKPIPERESGSGLKQLGSVAGGGDAGLCFRPRGRASEILWGVLVSFAGYRGTGGMAPSMQVQTFCLAPDWDRVPKKGRGLSPKMIFFFFFFFFFIFFDFFFYLQLFNGGGPSRGRGEQRKGNLEDSRAGG